MVLSKKWFYLFLSSFLFINLLVIFVKPISTDPSVYWFYAHHLRWVYQDAPPLIGVVTWLGITVFGSHSATINFLGLLSVLISASFLYLLAKSMFNENSARVAALIWLITPATSYIYVRWSWSYNNLILLFWIMTLYFFYQAGKTKTPRYFYFTALSLAGAILSQVNSGLLVVIVLLVLISLSSYRQCLKNQHFYYSLILLFLIICPYLIPLVKSGFTPLTFLVTAHANTSLNSFFFKPMLSLWNEIINAINLFFVFGLWFIIRNFKDIKKNEDLMFCLLTCGVLLGIAVVGALKYNIAIRYYYPFYFTFILLFIPFLKKPWIKWLMVAVYINATLFLVDSLNILIPQYGIAQGSYTFYNKNFEIVGHNIKQQVQENDLLIPCGFQTDFTTLAFHADHINTYFASPGLFIWQAPLQKILEQNKGNKIFYLCGTPTPPQDLNLNCGNFKDFSSTQYHWWPRRVYTSTYYLSQCTVK